MWKKTNKWGAIAGAVLGQWCGLVAWVVYAQVWVVGLALGFVNIGGGTSGSAWLLNGSCVLMPLGVVVGVCLVAN